MRFTNVFGFVAFGFCTVRSCHNACPIIVATQMLLEAKFQWAWGTLKKAVTGTQQKIELTQQKIKIDTDGSPWKEICALSSLVFGNAIGLVHNADLNDGAKTCLQKSIVRGHRVFISAIDREYRGTDVGNQNLQKFADVDKAVALCAHLVSVFEKLRASVQQLGQMFYDDGKMIRASLWPVTMELEWMHYALRLQGFE